MLVVDGHAGRTGRYGDLPERPPLEEVGRMREAELRCAAEKLGVSDLSLLDYIDGDLDKASQPEIAEKIAREIRRVRPQVVVSFGPEGAYGHPDHIAISQFTAAAIFLATEEGDNHPPHRVDKFYFMAWTRATLDAYQAAFKQLVTNVDGVDRGAISVPDWLITTRLDTLAYWRQVWEAVNYHKTQLAIYSKLANLPEKHHEVIWGVQQYYRVFSTVNGGRRIEDDLFEGLR